MHRTEIADSGPRTGVARRGRPIPSSSSSSSPLNHAMLCSSRSGSLVTRQLSAAAAICVRILVLLPRPSSALHRHHHPFPRSSHGTETRSSHRLAHNCCDTHLGGGGCSAAALGAVSPSRAFSSDRLILGRGYRRRGSTLPTHDAAAGVATLRCFAAGSSDGSSRQQREQQDHERQSDEGSLVLERVKNIRDLASVPGSGIVKGRVFRTGYLSEATAGDAHRLRDVTGLRTMVDLRSATERGRDKLIDADVYKDFVIVQSEEAGSGGGAVWDSVLTRRINDLLWGIGLELQAGGSDGHDEPGAEHGSRRRYFVSLIDESVYKKGVFQRLRRRHKAAVMALAPAMVVSRRCSKKARGIFIREINAGGLLLLNQLLLQYSGKGINRVLRLIASRERHPVALYCTAGKDRTGLVMALTLAVLGVPDSAIVEDYAVSDCAYRDLDDRDAMVGALAQEDLDPETFLCAPKHVMEDILRFIRTRYGSVEGYLDSIGFDSAWRARMRDALLVE